MAVEPDTLIPIENSNSLEQFRQRFFFVFFCFFLGKAPGLSGWPGLAKGTEPPLTQRLKVKIMKLISDFGAW
jgi:hypothetical protein